METETRSQYRTDLQNLLGRPVAYWPVLSNLLGSDTAAIMLSQMLYWTGVKTVAARGGWFWKSVSDMTAETGLSRDKQQVARSVLIRLGVIDAALTGIPRRWHYRVNMDRLTDLINNRSTGEPLNGRTVEWDERSTVEPPNIGRSSRGTFNGRAVQYSTGEPSNLNKNHRLHQENTNIDYQDTTTTTQPPRNGAAKAAGVVVVQFNESVLAALDKAGIMPGRRAAIMSTANEYGWSNEALTGLVDYLTREYGPERAAHLLEYRIKNDEPHNFTMRNAERDSYICPVCSCYPCSCEE